MAVIVAPRHEVEEMGRLEKRIQAQLFLDVLQGAFESAWERPEDLQRALAELPSTAKEEGRRRVLLSYLEAMRGCLMEVSEEGEGRAGTGAQGRSKRRRQARQQRRGSGSDQEESGTEETDAEAGLTAKGEHSRGETDVTRVKGPALLSEGGGSASATAVGRTDAIVRRPSSMAKAREGAVARVLTDDAMLGCMFGFLQGQTGRQSVKGLGQLGLVCRQWKKVACWEHWWTGIVAEVLPLSGGEDGEGNAEATRTHLVQYGRTLVEGRRVWRYETWGDGLELHFEVFDTFDGMQLLSARGAPCFVHSGGAYELQLKPCDRLEVRASPFSSADRGCAEMNDFATYVWWSNDADELGGLCVRVTVSDLRTGRKALLWEEGRGTERECVPPVGDWQSSGAVAIESISDGVVHNCSQHLDVECSTSIIVRPEEGQEGVEGRDRLYRVVGGKANQYDEGHGPLRLIMTGDDACRVPSWIMSLLKD